MIQFGQAVLIDKATPSGVTSQTYSAEEVLMPIMPMRLAPGNAYIVREDLTLIFVLYGGQSGESFDLGLRMTAPESDPRDILSEDTFRLTWPSGQYVNKFVVPFRLEVEVQVSGVFDLRLLVNGLEVGKVGVPIIWLDEIPDDQKGNSTARSRIQG